MTRTILTYTAVLALLVLAAAAFNQSCDEDCEADEATRCLILCQR